MQTPQAETFVTAALRNPVNADILQRLRGLAFPEVHLVAGSLFQAVWNGKSGRAAADDVKDYDIFYFDGGDLSLEAEDRVISRVRDALADMDITFDVKNQARVHLWYEQRFGRRYQPLRSTRDGIDRFLVAGTCVGLAPRPDGAMEVYAPFGLDDIFAGLLRPNPLSPNLEPFRVKANSYRARWPHLAIVETMAPLLREADRLHVLREIR